MKKLPVFAVVLLKIFFIHLFLFLIVRACFLAANFFWYTHSGVPGTLVLGSFVTGLRFDVNILAYALALPCLLLFLSEIFESKKIKVVAGWIIYLVLSLALFIACADIPYYIQFQRHLSSQALPWFSQGTTSLRLVFSDMDYWGYLLLFLPLGFVSVKTTHSFLRHFPNEKRSVVTSVSVFLGLACLMALAIRGRVGKTALHPGVAYTSEVMLTNQAALNANFTLAYSFLFPTENKDLFKSSDDIANFKKAESYLGITGPEFKREVKQADTVRKLNVVVVLMESMSTFKMGHFNQKVLTPNLVNLQNQSLSFSNFYSSGIHTYSGIFSTITGYPAILHEHALENYVFKKFESLPSVLKDRGYKTMFFVPHDEQFDNMNGFLTFNGIDEVYSDKDFADSSSLGAMGVPDHVLFDYVTQKLGTVKEPFFSLVLTASDHGPWEIPSDIPFHPTGKDEQERATQYADWSIGQFIEKVKRQPWFEHTLFVFLGDHGANHGRSYHMDIAFNQVPCVFYCPKYLRPQQNNEPAVQVDVFPTVMGMLGYGYTNRSFGVDLLKEKRRYAFFSQDDRIGCLDSKYYYYNLLFWGGKEYLVSYPDGSEKNLVDEKRKTADSLRNYLVTMLQAANYIVINQKY